MSKMWSIIYFSSLTVAVVAGAISLVSGYIIHNASEKENSKMQENIAVANKSAATAIENAALSNERTALLENEAAQAKLKLAKLKEEISKTNKKIEPRIITDGAAKKTIEVLSSMEGRKFIIKVMSEDFKGQDFSPMLIKLLVDSGWEYINTQAHGGWRFDDGIKIDAQSESPEIQSLYDLLNEYNFNPTMDTSSPDEYVRIYIGDLPK